jgi:hypothetical protein
MTSVLFAIPVTSAISQTFDYSIFRYQTFDNDTIFTSVQGPWSASVSVNHHSVLFGQLYFVAPHRHFLSAENILAINTH